MYYSSRCVSFFVLLLMWSVAFSELLEDEYEVIDGIKVRKDSIKQEMNQTDKGDKKPKSEDSENIEEDEDQDGGDDDDEDDDDDDDDDDDEDEDLESTKHLPTKCHVCRLLAVEVENKLAKIARIRKPRENKSPIYYKEEVVILRVMEDLCDVMKKYNTRPKHPFRYKRGVKSQYRKKIEELTKDSRIQKWVWATPEEEIDDPTGEIHRLKTQCHDMLVDGQHDLIHWFMKAQSHDLTKWLCAKRALLDDNQDCLKVEMPKRNRVVPIKPKTSGTTDKKTNGDTLHEEL